MPSLPRMYWLPKLHKDNTMAKVGNNQEMGNQKEMPIPKTRWEKYIDDEGPELQSSLKDKDDLPSRHMTSF